MADEDPRHCLNCGTVVVDTFCPHCGQKNTSYRVSLWLVLEEMLGEAFELDGRVPRTLVPFFFKPGVLTREYNAGKRASFTSPFRLFLAMALLWVSVGFVFTRTVDFEARLQEQAESSQLEIRPAPEATPPPSDEPASAFARHLTEREDALEQMTEVERAKLLFESALGALPKALLLLLPVFALVLKLLFLGTGRFYVEHLVFALHVHAMAFFMMTISFVIQDDLIGILLGLAFLLYVFLALRNAYAARWWTTALRFLALMSIYGLTAIIVSGLMVVGMLLL